MVAIDTDFSIKISLQITIAQTWIGVGKLLIRKQNELDLRQFRNVTLY